MEGGQAGNRQRKTLTWLLAPLLPGPSFQSSIYRKNKAIPEMNLGSERILSGLGKFPPQTLGNSTVNKQSSRHSRRPESVFKLVPVQTVLPLPSCCAFVESLARACAFRLIVKETFQPGLFFFSCGLPPAPHHLCPAVLRVNCAKRQLST